MKARIMRVAFYAADRRADREEAGDLMVSPYADRKYLELEHSDVLARDARRTQARNVSFRGSPTY